MASSKTAPGKADPQTFAAFERNVFEQGVAVRPEDLVMPFDPGERRAAARGRSDTFQDRIGRQLSDAQALHVRTMDEAARIISEAEDRAQEIALEAEHESATVEARAYQTGFAQGEEAGRKLGDQKIETIVKSLGAVVESLVAEQHDLLVASQQEIVKIASALALKIIQRELRQDPSAVLDVVRAAVSRVQEATTLTLHVSPSDFQFIENHLDDFRRLTRGVTEIGLEPDASVGRGGCRVHSDCGEVDATLRTMVHAFLNELMDEGAAERMLPGASPEDDEVSP